MTESESDRRDPTLRLAFDRAVEASAEIAAQKIAGVHRRRLVRWTAQVTAIVMLAIFIPAAVLLYENARDNARNLNKTSRALAHKNSIYDCGLFTREARLLGDYVKSDAQLRLVQARESIAGPLLRDFEKIIPVRQLLALSARSKAQSIATGHRWQQDAGRLLRLAGSDCARNLGG